MSRDRVANEKESNGIDITSDNASAKLETLNYRRSRSHEWIEHCGLWKARSTVKQVHDVGAFRCERPQRDRPKNRAKPLRPPFVNVRQGPVNFFPPRLAFRDFR